MAAVLAAQHEFYCWPVARGEPAARTAQPTKVVEAHCWQMAEVESKPAAAQESPALASKLPKAALQSGSKSPAWSQARLARYSARSPKHFWIPLELLVTPAASEVAASAAKVAAIPKPRFCATRPLPREAPRPPRNRAAPRRPPNLPAETRCPKHFRALQIPGQSEKVREPSAAAAPKPRALPCSSACCRVPAAEYPASRSNFWGRSASTGICSHGNSP